MQQKIMGGATRAYECCDGAGLLLALMECHHGTPTKMMTRNIGIVFYSRSGTARSVAQRLSTLSEWPAYEVSDVEPRAGLKGYAQCMVDVLLKRKPAFRYPGPFLNGFDHFVIISPVWLHSLAAPMRAFLQSQAPIKTDYSAICVTTGYGGFRVVEAMVMATERQPKHVVLLKRMDVLANECDEAIKQLRDNVLTSANRSSYIAK